MTPATLTGAGRRYYGCVEFSLRDGTKVFVRHIRPADKDMLQSGLRNLSTKTVYQRFMGAKPRFTSTELRYLTEVDGHDHVALVAELASRPGWIVGVARYVRLNENPDIAEMAILVVDEFQGRGAGSQLAELLAEEALRNGITRFRATSLRDNVAVHKVISRLARHLEPEHDYDGWGTESVLIDLAA